MTDRPCRVESFCWRRKRRSRPCKAALETLTNIVNFVFDSGEAIHDGDGIPPDTFRRDAQDVLALRDIWSIPRQLAVSPITYHEILVTTNPVRPEALQRWFGELSSYCRDLFDLSNRSDVKSGVRQTRRPPQRPVGTS